MHLLNYVPDIRKRPLQWTLKCSKDQQELKIRYYNLSMALINTTLVVSFDPCWISTVRWFSTVNRKRQPVWINTNNSKRDDSCYFRFLGLVCLHLVVGVLPIIGEAHISQTFIICNQIKWFFSMCCSRYKQWWYRQNSQTKRWIQHWQV